MTHWHVFAVDISWPSVFWGSRNESSIFFFLYRLLKPLKIRESLASIHQAPFSYRNGDSLRLHQFCLWRDNWFPLGLSICSWSGFPPSLLEFSSFCSYYHGGGFQNSLCTLLIIQKSRPCVFLELHMHERTHAHTHTHTHFAFGWCCMQSWWSSVIWEVTYVSSLAHELWDQLGFKFCPCHLSSM